MTLAEAQLTRKYVTPAKVKKITESSAMQA
jgi:hypothetical protein